MPAQRSTEAKALAGTLRRSRMPVESLPRLARVPDPPAYLTRRGVVEWRRVAAQAARVGCTQADVRGLALLAEALASVTELEEAIARDGVTIAMTGGGMKPHPALASLAQARASAHRLLGSFGLLPRERVSLPPPPQKEPKRNEFDEGDD